MSKLTFTVIGIIVGILICEIVFPPSTQLSRCVAMFSNNPELNQNDPQLREVMKKENVKDLNGLIEKRCKYWIKNGQQF